MEEMYLKWQMAMLSLRLTVLRKKGWYVKTDDEKLVEKVYEDDAGLQADNGVLMLSKAAAEAYQNAVKTLESQKDCSNATRTKVGLVFKEYFGENEVFDLSRHSTMYPEPVEQEVNPLYSWFVKAGEMHAVPPSITGTYMPSPYKSDIEKTQVSYGSKLSDLCVPVIQPQDQGPKTSHLLYKSRLCHESEEDFCPMSIYSSNVVPAGSRNSPASVTAGGSDPAASRNRPAANSADRPHPAGWDYFMLLDIAGWLVSATSHLVSAGSLHSCWCNKVSAA
ncbi:hypothetical protein Tco_0269915 [Tanacetum coccineum]